MHQVTSFSKHATEWTLSEISGLYKLSRIYFSLDIPKLNSDSKIDILKTSEKISLLLSEIDWGSYQFVQKTYLILTGKVVKIILFNLFLPSIANKVDRLADCIRQPVSIEKTVNDNTVTDSTDSKQQVAVKLSLVDNALKHLAYGNKYCPHLSSYRWSFDWKGLLSGRISLYHHNETFETHQVKTRKDELVTYFKNLHLQLSSGLNVPVSQWYHATGSEKDGLQSVRSILEKSELIPGRSGLVCASTEEEDYYGPVSFAFDLNTWKNRIVSYYHRDEINPSSHLQTWISTSERIAFTENNLAFIATEKRLLNSVKNAVHECGKSILVIDRELSWQIRYFLELSEERKYGARVVPSTWTNDYQNHCNGSSRK